MAVSGGTMRAVLLQVLILTVLIPTVLVPVVLMGCGTDPSSTQAPEGSAEPSPSATEPSPSATEPSPSAAEPSPSAAEPSPSVSAGSAPFEWEDPEPPEAQALAEQVVRAEWNQDKTLAIKGATSRLGMHITTLLYPTTGITGFQSQVAADKTSLEDRLRKLGAEVTDLQVTIRLAGSILFDFDKSAIRPDARRTLEEVAAVLQAYGEAPVRIEGHTDAIGGDAYNQTLSETRARSVADWFTGEGIDRTRLKALGHGETQPVAGNDSAEGRQLNRRVEIVVERPALLAEQ